MFFIKLVLFYLSVMNKKALLESEYLRLVPAVGANIPPLLLTNLPESEYLRLVPAVGANIPPLLLTNLGMALANVEDISCELTLFKSNFIPTKISNAKLNT